MKRYGGIINMPNPYEAKKKKPTKLPRLWPWYCILLYFVFLMGIGFIILSVLLIGSCLIGLTFIVLILQGVYERRRLVRDIRLHEWLQKDLPVPEETDWEAFERNTERSLRYGDQKPRVKDYAHYYDRQ